MAKTLTRGLPWTKNEIEELRDSSPFSTAEQLAEFFGRSPSSIYAAARRNNIKMGSGPMKMPSRQNPRGILLAKSCAKCGMFMDAKMFSKNQKRRDGVGYESRCRKCAQSGGTESYRRNVEKSKALNDAKNAATMKSADRYGLPWEQYENAAIEDTSKSSLQLAFELKRNYRAVVNQRSKRGIVLRKKLDREANVWHLVLPAAAEALREEFKKLGVPESEWDWND